MTAQQALERLDFPPCLVTPYAETAYQMGGASQDASCTEPVQLTDAKDWPCTRCGWTIADQHRVMNRWDVSPHG